MLNAWVNKDKYACLYVHTKEKICITDSNSYIKNIPPIVTVLRESINSIRICNQKIAIM